MLCVPLVVDWARSPRTVNPLLWTAIGLVDGAAYGAGVWRGCLAERTAAPLQPRFAGLSRRRR
jgi:mycofactocin glycosyltransferase